MKKAHSRQQNPQGCVICHCPSFSSFCFKDGFDYVSCEKCRHVYVYNPVCEDEICKIYSTRKSHHSSDIKETWDYSDLKKKYFYNPLLSRISRFVSIGKILDIGCSNGAFLNAARTMGWETFGIELEEGSYTIALNRGLNVFKTTLAGQKFPSHYFEAVTMWGVLEHLSNPREVVSEVNRILIPGGVFAFNTPNIHSLGWKILRGEWGSIAPVAHLNLFSVSGLTRLLQESHFEVKVMETLEMQPYTFRQIMAMLKRKTIQTEINSVAKMAKLNAPKLLALLGIRRITNLPLKILGWGEDIYGYAQKL